MLRPMIQRFADNKRLGGYLLAVVAIPGFSWLLFYCLGGQTPVHRVTLDKGLVGSIVVGKIDGGSGPLVVRDGGIIAQGIEEINGMDYTPSDGSAMAGPYQLLFRDNADNPIVEFSCCFPRYIEVRLAGKRPFRIRGQPAPVMGRLIAYMLALDARRFLEKWAKEPPEEFNAGSVEFRLRDLRLGFRVKVVPRTLEELKVFVGQLPDFGLDRWDTCADYFADSAGSPYYYLPRKTGSGESLW
jgi:hypothetical protein